MANNIHVHIHDNASDKVAIQQLISEASQLKRKMTSLMKPKADYNKFLIEASNSMDPAISALQEAKAFA